MYNNNLKITINYWIEREIINKKTKIEIKKYT